MPRGVKGSGKPKVAKTTRTTKATKATTTKKVAEQPVVEEITAKKRKAYPTYEERLVLADQAIARLTKLNADRKALIEQTEAKLNERKAALVKSEEALEKATAKKARIIEAMNKPVKEAAPKMSKEERAQLRRENLAKAREARKAEKEKMDTLMAALKESGKSVDDLLAQLQK